MLQRQADERFDDDPCTWHITDAGRIGNPVRVHEILCEGKVLLLIFIQFQREVVETESRKYQESGIPSLQCLGEEIDHVFPLLSGKIIKQIQLVRQLIVGLDEVLKVSNHKRLVMA